MLEDLKAHPAVAPVISGAKLVEHSGHMVPEGGINMMPELTADGVLVAGDAAMMCVNLGYTVRGHAKHLYAKLDVHSRRDLLDLIDAVDTDSQRTDVRSPRSTLQRACRRIQAHHLDNFLEYLQLFFLDIFQQNCFRCFWS